jgi:hypothetical protein
MSHVRLDKGFVRKSKVYLDPNLPQAADGLLDLL